jgi:hypothetical protein
MLNYYSHIDDDLLADIKRVRAFDKERGIVFAPKCRTIGCVRRARTDDCDYCTHHCRCLKGHARKIKTLTHYKAKRSRSPALHVAGRRKCVKGGKAQALFSVEHILNVPFLDKLADHCAKVGHDKDFWMQLLTTCAIQIMHVFHNPDKTTIALAISQVVMTLPIARKLTGELITSIIELFTWATKQTNAQSDNEDYESVAKVIYAALMGFGVLIPAILVAKLPNSSDITNFINRFSKVGSCVKSFETLKDVVKPSIDSLTDYIRTKFLGLEPRTIDAWHDIDAWCDEVSQLNTTDFEKNIVRSKLLKEKVESLLIRGDKILKLLDSLKIPIAQRSRVSNLMLFLHKARAMVAHSGAGYTEPRVAPLVVHMVGDTGVGKSSMLPMLNSHLLVEMGCRDPNDLFEKVYYRDPTSEFWDGFNEGARILVVDDIGQVKDSIGSKNPEPMECIRTGNTAYFAPNMAHLENKGTTVFRCNVLIWTSNVPIVNFESLTFPDAVAGRVNLKFKQVPAKDYELVREINGRVHVSLNSAKVADEAIDDPLVYEKAIEFIQLEATGTHELSNKRLSFREMTQIVLEAYRAKMSSGDRFNDFQKQYFNTIAGQAQSGVRVHWEPNFLRRGFGASVHLALSNSLEHYEPLAVPTVVAEGDVTGLRKVDCVEIAPKLCDRFMRSYATAMFAAESCTGSEAEKDKVFDNVFFAVGAIRPGMFKVCHEHKNFVPGFAKRWYLKVVKAFSDVSRNLENYVEDYNRQTLAGWNLGFEEQGFRPDEIPEMPKWVIYFSWFINLAALITPYIVMLLCFRAAYTWIRNLIHKWSGGEDDYDSAEGYNPGTNKGRAPTNRENYQPASAKGRQNTNRENYAPGSVKGRVVTNVESNAQAILDQNAAEVASTVINNIYAIQYWSLGGWEICQTGTIIKGRILLTNKHLLNTFKGLKKWRVINHSGAYEFDATAVKSTFADESCEYGSRDLCLIELPRNVPQHRDITKFFVSKEDYAYFNTIEWVSLLGFSPNQSQLILRQYFSNVCAASDGVFALSDSTEERFVRNYFQYGIQTRFGDCGALMIMYDKNRHKKLAGIHMAGVKFGRYQGIAQALHIEALNELLSRLEGVMPDSLISCEPVVESGVAVVSIPLDETSARVEIKRNVQGSFLEFGTVKEPIHKNVKTRIFPSPLHGVITTPTMKPAMLRPFVRDGVEYDPLELARKKASTPSVKLDDTLLNAATEHLKCLVLTNRKEGDSRVLTHEEAIRGIEGDEFIQGVCRKTSPGYGWKKSGKGKHAYLSDDSGEWKTDHPEVVEKCNNIRDVCASGGRPCTFWTDTLKDERRPIEKVNQGKTRLFSAGEMAYSIVFRQYFLPFIAHMMRNRITFEATVGINVYSYEWTVLAKRLTEVGNKVIAGDFTNYDGTLASEMLWKCLDIVESYFDDASEKERTIRRGLWSEIVHSIHIDGNVIYGWSHSQPSGCPMTTILNCLYHSISVRYVYMLCAKKYSPEHFSLDYYNMYVRHANYGDDDVTNIADEIVEWFNQETISEAYKELGMVYTDEAKTGDIVKYRYLKDIAFLKRRFRWDEDTSRYWAPLALETIREMAMWVHGRVDVHALTADTLQEAVHELAMHDSKTFHKEVPVFAQAARRLDVPTYVNTYDYYRQVEAFRWGMGQNNDLRDRGQPQMIESGCAANPAGVGLGREGYPRSRRERYLPLEADVCPSKNNRLSARSISRRLKSAAKMNKGLAQSTTNATEQMSGNMEEVPSPVMETHQILTFTEESVVPTEGAPSTTMHRYYVDAQDDNPNELTDFLSREIELKNFSWPSNTGVISSLTTVELPNDWIATAMILEKLQGFRFLRCDFVVRIQVNAQQFNAGLLRLVFNPFEKQLQLAPSNFIHFGGLTGYHGIDLDLGDGDSVELRIPFLNVASHFDLVTAAQALLGTVHVVVYSPLTGLNDVDGVVFLRAENIDFEMPTGLGVSSDFTAPLKGVAQSKGPRVTQNRRPKRTMPEGLSSADNDEDVTPLLDRIQTRIDSEKSRPGTIETMSRSVGRVARSFLAVPFLGMYARTLTWVADAVGATASLFGWSKPNDPEFTTPVTYQFGTHFTNYNGDVKAKVMAMDYRNENDVPAEIFGTSEDEMAIKSIITRPTYIDRFSYSTSSTYKQVLWSWPVDATACLKDKYSDPTPPQHYAIRRYNNLVSYLASMFRYWRGELCYNFKVVKSVFHSGRIRIVWVPGADESTDFTTVDINKCYSEVIDLHFVNRFTFCVPFAWNLPWKRSDEVNSDPNDIRKSWAPPLGMIYIIAITGLRTAPSASTTIDTIVEGYAGDDFQFAYPEIALGEDFRIWLRANLPVLKGRAQNNISESKISDVTPNVLGMGEAITSLRQVLKRYDLFPNVWNLPAAFQDSRAAPSGDTGVTIAPNSTVWLSDASIGQNLQSNQVSWFDMVASLYRFQSGSMRLLLTSRVTQTDGDEAVLTVFNSTNDVSRIDQWATIDSVPNVYHNRPYACKFHLYEPYQELHVPFYSPFPVNLGPLGRPENHILPTSKKVSNGAGPRVFYYHTGKIDEFEVRRSIGEDFSFGYLVGPPVTAIRTNS